MHGTDNLYTCPVWSKLPPCLLGCHSQFTVELEAAVREALRPLEPRRCRVCVETTGHVALSLHGPVTTLMKGWRPICRSEIVFVGETGWVMGRADTPATVARVPFSPCVTSMQLLEAVAARQVDDPARILVNYMR